MALPERTNPSDDCVRDFIIAACVAPESDHASGTLDQAAAILAAHPNLPSRSIQAAAVLGDQAWVRQFLSQDPSNARARGGPYGWDPLTYLCFSKYLRLDRARGPEFVRAAEALLDAGADANTGFYSSQHQPEPQFESVLYAAAGIAHHPELTRLLLERGADPNDGEVPYHSPEGFANAALKILVESGKLNQDSLTTMLLRKIDWHDCEAIQWLLQHGANPNRISHWGKTALFQAVLRDNARRIIEVLLEHGADPTLTASGSHRASSLSGQSAVSLAARRGRGDLLELFQARGFPSELSGVERLIAACARHDAPAAIAISQAEPQLLTQLLSSGGQVLSTFAGNGNTPGVELLLDLGVDIRASFEEGDNYFGVAPRSTALHVAAWRARHDTVRLLLRRGAPVAVLDGARRTPLALAVRACVDSHWTERRSPESVLALLEAGATVEGIPIPCGYTEVDELLRARRESG